MSKALVIPGANFTSNKLTKVNLVEENPCTGLVLSDSTKNLQGIGTTYKLTATVTPFDTTDVLSFASSNENVVAVLQDGTITVVGVGTATITARCGSQTATCAVTTTVVVDANTEYVYQNGYGVTDNDLSATPPQDSVQASAGARYRAYYYGENVYNGYKAFSNYNSSAPFIANAFPIPVPNGATTLEIECSDSVNNFQFALLDSQTHNTIYDSTQGRWSAKVVSPKPAGTQTINKYSVNLLNYSGYDSFVFGFLTSSDASAYTGSVTVRFT